MTSPADIDRLVDEGLTLYGAGDLDGALLRWEEALALDPDNAQANSYVDYVRMNYEVLHTESGLSAPTDEPFGIEDEPDYIIEITQGHELVPNQAPPLYMDPLDEGWFIEDEQTHEVQTLQQPSNRNLTASTARTISTDVAKRESSQILELEADEPPDEELLARVEAASLAEVSFDSPTREYAEGYRDSGVNEFASEEGSFKAESTPLGFGNLETSIKKREMGFVQPTQVPAPLEVRLRTPSSAPPVAEKTDLHATARGIPVVTRTPAPAAASVEDELISSLPSPRSKAVPLSSSQPLPVVKIPARAPADDIALPGAQTRDLGDLPPQLTPMLELAISAPTQDIGLRKAGRPASVYPDEDAPTRQNDARQIREHAHAKASGSTAGVGDGTRTDVVLPFDPIDARSASILDEVDTNEPPNEAKEDRTRRRISGLIERATTWSANDELDKAAAAVDLALSEDPNSALAQKLIHRNRDAIMAIFQNFLGNLDRQPALARPLHELATAPISPRAAFLLSRIDGALTIDEILDVSGMPRLEAYRHLTQLFLRGILR